MSTQKSNKSDRDSAFKQLAVNHCLANNLLPFIEVPVRNIAEFSEHTYLLTDLDVLGIEVGMMGDLKRTFFDCKTMKQSPINRAFWSSGVLNYTKSEEAFVILKKEASEAHRMSAKAINVHLFTGDQFSKFANSFNPDFQSVSSYVSVANWRYYRKSVEQSKRLKEIFDFANYTIPLSLRPDGAFRKLVSICQSKHGEFDPKRDLDMDVYAMAISAGTILLSQIVADLKYVFDEIAGKEKFESILRYYIWGGRENYSLFVKLKEKAFPQKLSKSNLLEFKNWDDFIELIRALLDAPTAVYTCCGPARELSFRSAEQIDIEKDRRLNELLSQNNRVRQFLFRISDYLSGASGFPAGCNEKYKELINRLMDDR